jgi:ribosomal protein S13
MYFIGIFNIKKDYIINIINHFYSINITKINYKPSINKLLNLNLLVDDLIKFNRWKLLEKEMKKSLSILTFFIQRVGISIVISKYIIKFLGVNYNLTLFYIPSNNYFYKIRTIFLNNKTLLDVHIKSYMLKKIKESILLHTRKGQRHYYHYPVRGQRTRSNARTSKQNLLRI